MRFTHSKFLIEGRLAQLHFSGNQRSQQPCGFKKITASTLIRVKRLRAPSALPACTAAGGAAASLLPSVFCLCAAVLF